MAMETLPAITAEEVQPTLHRGRPDAPMLGTTGMQELMDAHANLNTRYINAHAETVNRNLQNVLARDNEEPYTPQGPYQPATLETVQQAVFASGGGDMNTLVYDPTNQGRDIFAQATETRRGMAAIATAEEAAEGMDEQKMMTPKITRMFVDGGFSRVESTLLSMQNALEDALFGVYALTMRAYYDNKPVPQRATLFYDGFFNYAQCDDTLTTAHLQNGLHHYDRYFGQGEFESTVQKFTAQTQFSHVMKPSGPFYLYDAKVTINNQYVYNSSPTAVQLCATTLDGQNKPTGFVAEVLSSFQTKTEYNGSKRQHTFPISTQGVYVDAGQYGLMLAAPGIQQANEWINFSMFARTRNPDSYLYENGALSTYSTAHSPFIGKLIYVNNPPVYYSKEITPLRPVTTATLFISCDNASLGNLRPSMALYNPGDTPQYIALTNTPGENSSTADGLIESVWRLPAVSAATRARLRLQFAGLNPENTVKQYGCFLGG